jgi:hypothetical protein
MLPIWSRRMRPSGKLNGSLFRRFNRYDSQTESSQRRKGMPSSILGEDEFKRRFLVQFQDLAFSSLQAGAAQNGRRGLGWLFTFGTAAQKRNETGPAIVLSNISISYAPLQQFNSTRASWPIKQMRRPYDQSLILRLDRTCTP